MDIWQQEQGHSTNDIMPYLRRLVHAWTEIKAHSGRNHQLSVFGEVQYGTGSGNSVCCRIQPVMESTIIILFY
jgi:hypothetical protein